MSDAGDDEVFLSVNGTDYGGWKDVAITRSIETIAGDFNLLLTERWAGVVLRRRISDGDACTVKIGADIVITGYVDIHQPAIDDESHDIRASGRDKAGDLVDCSAMNRPGEWSNRSALQIVAALCEPFGIGVSATTDVGKAFASFKLQESEKAFEAIDRACKARALLPVSDRRGGLVLMRSGRNAARVDAPLELGMNIKIIRSNFSMLDRFSEIIVKGQQTQLDGMTADQASGPSGRATDPSVKRYRPLIVIADEEGDGVTLRDRALWEVSVRAGRARSAEITVRGWRNRTGALWEPNTIIPVKAPIADIDGDMLITSVRYSMGEEGRLTILRVSDPRGFDLIALEEAKNLSGDVGDALTGKLKYIGAGKEPS